MECLDADAHPSDMSAAYRTFKAEHKSELFCYVFLDISGP